MNLIDHWTIALVFMIAIINIFIAAFATGTSSIDTTPTPEPPIEPEVSF
jgi:cytochrome b561